jgi:hypothetical protein
VRRRYLSCRSCDDLDTIGIGLGIWRWKQILPNREEKKKRFVSGDISNIIPPDSFLFLLLSSLDTFVKWHKLIPDLFLAVAAPT